MVPDGGHPSSEGVQTDPVAGDPTRPRRGLHGCGTVPDSNRTSLLRPREREPPSRPGAASRTRESVASPHPGRIYTRRMRIRITRLLGAALLIALGVLALRRSTPAEVPVAPGTWDPVSE